MRGRVALLALLACGCTVTDVFVCERDEQCVRDGARGRCEAAGACSFADPLCASGWRYAAFAPAALAEACVEDLPVVADAAPRDAAQAIDAPGAVDAATPPDAAGLADGAIVELVFPVVADTTLKSNAANTAFGDAAELRADRDSVALLRFDVAAVGLRDVSAVFLHVTTTASGGLTRGSVEIFRLLEAWSEPEATWNERQAGVAWATAGAGAPGSRDGTVLGSAVPSADGTEYVIALPSSVVEGWARSGGTSHGLVLQVRDQMNRALALESREGGGGQAAFLRVRLAAP